MIGAGRWERRFREDGWENVGTQRDLHPPNSLDLVSTKYESSYPSTTPIGPAPSWPAKGNPQVLHLVAVLISSSAKASLATSAVPQSKPPSMMKEPHTPKSRTQPPFAANITTNLHRRSNDPFTAHTPSSPSSNSPQTLQSLPPTLLPH